MTNKITMASCSRCKQKMDRSKLSSKGGGLFCKSCWKQTPKIFRMKFEKVS